MSRAVFIGGVWREIAPSVAGPGGGGGLAPAATLAPSTTLVPQG